MRSDLDQRRERTLRTILQQCVAARRQELEQAAFDATKGRVIRGPFEGLALSRDVSWAGDLGAKLLGVYEAELHEALQRACARRPAAIVNIGCAEGFYAVGLARMAPEAQVLAYDISENAQRVTQATARLNDVADRVTVSGACDPETLTRQLGRFERALVVCDCEGYEAELFADEHMGAFARHDLIIECHDFARPGVTAAIAKRFSPSHRVQVLRSRQHDINGLELVARLSDLDRALLTCEFRPCVMTWVCCEAPAQA